jgi:hypothetical protein
MEAGRHVSFCDVEATKIMMKKPALYERVALTRDLDEHGLKRGDVATLVDTVPHPTGGAEGLVLEVTNALGHSLHVVVVKADDVEPLTADEILAVRPIVESA